MQSDRQPLLTGASAAFQGATLALAQERSQHLDVTVGAHTTTAHWCAELLNLELAIGPMWEMHPREVSPVAPAAPKTGAPKSNEIDLTGGSGPHDR